MSQNALQNPGKGFFPFIHILRGLAPVLVVWAHLGIYFAYDRMGGNWEGVRVWNQYFALPLNLYESAGHLGVLLFFLVSGFIITFASLHESRLEFCIKRVFRIFPALAFALLLTYLARKIALDMGLGELTNTRADSWIDFVRSFFLLDMILGGNKAIGVTWSLVPEIMFYALTAAFIGSSRAAPEKATYLMVGCWLAFEMISAGYPPLNHMKYFSPYVAMLLLGRTIYLSDSGVIGWRKGATLALLIGILFVLVYSHRHPGLLFHPPTAPAASYALAIAMFLAAMTFGFARVPRLLNFLADISLSLYLLHIPVGMLINTVGVSRGFSFNVILPMSVLACLGVAWLSFKLIEKPSQLVARRLINRKGRATAPQVKPWLTGHRRADHP